MCGMKSTLLAYPSVMLVPFHDNIECSHQCIVLLYPEVLALHFTYKRGNDNTPLAQISHMGKKQYTVTNLPPQNSDGPSLIETYCLRILENYYS